MEIGSFIIDGNKWEIRYSNGTTLKTEDPPIKGIDCIGQTSY